MVFSKTPTKRLVESPKMFVSVSTPCGIPYILIPGVTGVTVPSKPWPLDQWHAQRHHVQRVHPGCFRVAKENHIQI